MYKVFMFLIILFLVGCGEKENNKNKTDIAKELGTTYFDEKMKTSKNKIIRNAGKLGVVSTIHKAIKQKEVDDLNRLVKFGMDKVLSEDRIIKNIHKEIKINEIFKNIDSEEGYLGKNKEFIFGYEITNFNKTVLLTNNEFKQLRQHISLCNSFSVVNELPFCKKQKSINSSINILYTSREKQFSIIYNDLYFSWFKENNCSFSSIIN